MCTNQLQKKKRRRSFGRKPGSRLQVVQADLLVQTNLVIYNALLVFVSGVQANGY